MTGSFANRHIGTDSSAQALMLNVLGYDSLGALMDAAVPGHLRMAEIAHSVIPAAASEAEALAELRVLANANTVRRSLIGQGYYGTYTPSVIKTQHSGEPQLVYRVYAVSARNFPGPFGSTVELSDHGF